ncbi:MAG: hypothetical protein N2037_02100 [Acidimicrobiales bacterium]|nr:hypothetical protein [Acidimicrobiales bacterium]
MTNRPSTHTHVVVVAVLGCGLLATAAGCGRSESSRPGLQDAAQTSMANPTAGTSDLPGTRAATTTVGSSVQETSTTSWAPTSAVSTSQPPSAEQTTTTSAVGGPPLTTSPTSPPPTTLPTPDIVGLIVSPADLQAHCMGSAQTTGVTFEWTPVNTTQAWLALGDVPDASVAATRRSVTVGGPASMSLPCTGSVQQTVTLTVVGPGGKDTERRTFTIHKM